MPFNPIVDHQNYKIPTLSFLPFLRIIPPGIGICKGIPIAVNSDPGWEAEPLSQLSV